MTLENIPRWRQWFFYYKSWRNVPFRKRFFVGYDLLGNTYWEFKLQSSDSKLRRKMQPGKRQAFILDYFDQIPVQWHQWLRYTRPDPPSLQELILDQHRLLTLKQNIKKLSNHTWTLNIYLFISYSIYLSNNALVLPQWAITWFNKLIFIILLDLITAL